MNILALDTTLEACSAAVRYKRDGAFAETASYERLVRGHAERIMGMVRQVMRDAGLAFEEVDRIAVTIGPGTFTGVRIGLAAARGLALAADKLLVGETSLRVIAKRFIDDAHGAGNAPFDRPFAVAVDARRGQVYLQSFTPTAEPLTAPCTLSPADAAAALPSGMPVIASGAPLITGSAPDETASHPASHATLQPDAISLVRLAPALAVSAEPVSPLYLRAPDAKPQDGARLARQ